MDSSCCSCFSWLVSGFDRVLPASVPALVSTVIRIRWVVALVMQLAKTSRIAILGLGFGAGSKWIPGSPVWGREGMGRGPPERRNLRPWRGRSAGGGNAMSEHSAKIEGSVTQDAATLAA